MKISLENLYVAVRAKRVKRNGTSKHPLWNNFFLFTPFVYSFLVSNFFSVSQAGKRPIKRSSVSSVRSCSKFSKLQLVHIHHKAVGVLSSYPFVSSEKYDPQNKQDQAGYHTHHNTSDNPGRELPAFMCFDFRSFCKVKQNGSWTLMIGTCHGCEKRLFGWSRAKYRVDCMFTVPPFFSKIVGIDGIIFSADLIVFRQCFDHAQKQGIKKVFGRSIMPPPSVIWRLRITDSQLTVTLS